MNQNERPSCRITRKMITITVSENCLSVAE